MNWYVKCEATGEIAGPMTEGDALSKAELIDVLVFNDELFNGMVPGSSHEDVERLLSEMKSVAEAEIVIPKRNKELVQRAIDTILFLSREKVVTGVIDGGVLHLDELPPGVSVDIRDYDTEGVDEEEYAELNEDSEGNKYFEAG